MNKAMQDLWDSEGNGRVMYAGNSIFFSILKILIYQNKNNNNENKTKKPQTKLQGNLPASCASTSHPRTYILTLSSWSTQYFLLSDNNYQLLKQAGPFLLTLLLQRQWSCSGRQAVSSPRLPSSGSLLLILSQTSDLWPG